MLKKPASFVLGSSKSSTYPRGYASGFDLPAALLAGFLSILRCFRLQRRTENFPHTFGINQVFPQSAEVLDTICLISCQDSDLSPSDFLGARPQAQAKGRLFTTLKEYFLTADKNDGIPIAHDIFLQAIDQTCLWGDYRRRDTVGWVDRGPEDGFERILRS